MRAGAGYAAVRPPRAADASTVQDLSGRTMGTLWSLRLDNPRMLALEAVRECVERCFDRVIAQMSTWESGSDICRYNRAPAGSTHELAPEFFQVLDCAWHWASASEGAFDLTVGPLIGLWGFGAQARPAALPTAQALESARRQVGWQRLSFDRDAATIHQPGGIALDLSGIAKGFAVDHACAALQAMGLSDFLLEVGGELRASGRRPDGSAWRVQVETAEGLGTAVALHGDMSIATSGDRWHRHGHDGQHWSHTIDPLSGLPVQHGLAGVSVLHRECMQADALATLLTVLGPEEGMAFARKHEVAALFVTRLADGALRQQATARWVDVATARA
ncbi:FAD:protein FMN transferase [Variovorax sp. OV329]|uniref:FAD:protein FMN transferase n=1 Tax=Variovorax sp. OV329 TaxID=1882825 RepID=UPI0008EB5299|nr:FAD:protein FMN transferase [Variovorax sp. OV329]SFM54604.1 thiamine biosynthesis lipoprotein [Variovorax sp. OV329]